MKIDQRNQLKKQLWRKSNAVGTILRSRTILRSIGRYRFRRCKRNKFFARASANLAEVRDDLFTQSALSRSYFYRSVAGIHRRRVLRIRRVLWSLVTPYGVDGAQRVAPVLESLKSRAAALSPSPWTLSLSFILSLSRDQHLETIAERDSGGSFVFGPSALFTWCFTVCCRVTRFRGFTTNVCRK